MSHLGQTAAASLPPERVSLQASLCEQRWLGLEEAALRPWHKQQLGGLNGFLYLRRWMGDCGGAGC